MNFVQVDLTLRHLVRRVLEVIFEQPEILFVDLVHKMHRQIVEEILDRMRPLWPMSCAFIKARYFGQIDRMRQFGAVQNRLHALVELFGPENPVIATAVQNERRDVPRLRRPVNIRVHGLAKPDGVAGKQEKPAEHFDLIKVAVHVDPVLLR